MSSGPQGSARKALESLGGGGGGGFAAPSDRGADCATACGGLPAPAAAHPGPAPQAFGGGPTADGRDVACGPYKEHDYAALAASGARHICPRRDAHDWPVTDNDAETFKEVVLVGTTAHEAQSIAAAALDKWPTV